MKWKLNIKKEVKATVALVGVSFLIAFSEREMAQSVCKDIVIDIDNVQENHFLDEADVLKLVESAGLGIRGVSLNKIDLKQIEDRIKSDRHIQDAELFGDLKGNLIVNVKLRRPVARIIQSDAPDAYISEEGVIMPVSEKYTSRVMLVSGPFVKQLLESEDLNTTEAGKQLMEMIAFVNEDEFWKAQVAQLDIDHNGEITILPQMTGQRIEFGKPENMEEKFRKLMIFYKEILPQRGWTKYERVNLEFEGQIIAE